MTEGACGRCSSGLMKGRYLLITTDTLCRFYQAVASHGHRKWDSFGEVPSLPVKWALRPLAPSVLGLRPKPPPSGREVFTEAFCKVTLPGAGGAVTIRRRLSCALSAATRRGSLRLGAAPQATADCQSNATLFFQKTSKGVFQSRHFLGR